MSHKQLSYEKRCQIKAFLQSKIPVARIAQLVGVHKSTVYREIGRNKNRRGYQFKQAHRKTLKRRQARAKPYRLTRKVIWSASLMGGLVNVKLSKTEYQ